MTLVPLDGHLTYVGKAGRWDVQVNGRCVGRIIRRDDGWSAESLTGAVLAAGRTMTAAAIAAWPA